MDDLTLATNKLVEKRRSTDKIDLAEDGVFRDFVSSFIQTKYFFLIKGHYMQVKAQKLMHQIHDNVLGQKSELFKGISIHVNGHTSKSLT